ncbi:MAG: NAD(+)/NADH kinase [Clostridia bacterium]|nr:NAD(+)/NADH kinase [Clostridia bacterium]
MPIKRIGILSIRENPSYDEVAGRFARAVEAAGGICVSGPDYTGCDVLAVIGGDGSILSALEESLRLDVPILGVNMGRVGYLTETQVGDIERDVGCLLSGQYRIEERMLLEARSGDASGVALNEVSFKNAAGAVGILSLEVSSHEAVIDRFSGDGLVIATATGSTAYSLSAGGPILSPELDCLVLTPVCPHMLRARPVVISANETVRVRVTDNRAVARILLDGRRSLPDSAGRDGVLVRRAAAKARFVRISRRNFYDLLHEKLSDWKH